MLMNPPPSGLGASPLASPSPINRQMIQPWAVPGLQSKNILGRGSTGLGPLSGQAGPTSGQGGQMSSTGGMGGMNPMAANNPNLMNLLGH